MAKCRMDLPGFVGKLLQEQDGDVLREGVRVLAQALMEAEVTELVGAERHERTAERDEVPQRESAPELGYTGRHDRARGSEGADRNYYPSLLQSRRRAEQALRAVVHDQSLGHRCVVQAPARRAARLDPTVVLRTDLAPADTPLSRVDDWRGGGRRWG